MAKSRSDLATIAAVSQLAAVVLTIAALYFARDVFIPLALGVLLSFLLSPAVNRLHRFGISNVFAVVVTATLAFVFLAVIFTMLGRELTTLVSDLPDHKDELVTKARGFAGLTTGMGGSLDELADEVTEALEKSELEEEEQTPEPSLVQQWTDRFLPAPEDMESVEVAHDGTSIKGPLYVKQVEDRLPLATWATTAGTVLGPLATAGLVTVFALFMLIHREDLRDRIIAVISHGDYVTTTEAFDEAGNRISRYLIAQTTINTGYGLVLSIGLMIIGGTMSEGGAFPNAILWGVLATCLRYIPYLGPIAASVLPSLLALAVFPGYNVFIAVVALITVMELISNNVVEPWLYGASTGISAVAVIVAAVFWAWLWGPVGLLLSTPLTVCLVVLGRYVRRFRILATLFGEHFEIKNSIRFYQRLLAGDHLRADELLAEHRNANDFDATCDQVLIPTLKRIRNDQEADFLSEKDASRLFSQIGGLIAKLETEQTTEANADADAKLATEPEHSAGARTVIGCASHHFSETFILNLLRIGGTEAFKLNTLDDEMMPKEIGKHITQLSPPAVVIMVLPKGGFAQARYLCKCIRDEGYSGMIVVACFGRFKNFNRLFVKFRKAGANSMTTSFTQTRSKLESIVRQNVQNSTQSNTPQCIPSSSSTTTKISAT